MWTPETSMFETHFSGWKVEEYTTPYNGPADKWEFP